MAGVAFYISGHGFGHASRQVEIVNAFARRQPDVGIFVRTAVARWLLDRTLVAPFELDDRPTDTGVVQIDSLHLDAEATIAAADDFHATLDARAAHEADLLRARDVRLVLADAPPLACAAAARAGIPSVVVSNFTWDWITPMREYLAGAPELIPTIQAAYGLADEAWRLPMHGGFESFLACPAEAPSARARAGPAEAPSARRRVIDLPFVARHATRAPAETRTRLGLPADRKLVLPSFGGYGVGGIDLSSVDLDPSWHVIAVPDAAIYDAGLRYEDLVRAADVVLSKPGYGIISECIANGAALVYTSAAASPSTVSCGMPRLAASISGAAGRWRASAPP